MSSLAALAAVRSSPTFSTRQAQPAARALPVIDGTMSLREDTGVLRSVVESQIVLSVGYDEHSSVLEVQFRNGWIYQYDDVPKIVFQSLMSAPSHGRYLKRSIVDKYPTRRIL